MGDGPDNQYTGKLTLLMLSCIDGLLIYCRATSSGRDAGDNVMCDVVSRASMRILFVFDLLSF